MFSIVKNSYLEDSSNIIINGNLTVNKNVSIYLDTKFDMFPAFSFSWKCCSK